MAGGAAPKLANLPALQTSLTRLLEVLRNAQHTEELESLRLALVSRRASGLQYHPQRKALAGLLRRTQELRVEPRNTTRDELDKHIRNMLKTIRSMQPRMAIAVAEVLEKLKTIRNPPRPCEGSHRLPNRLVSQSIRQPAQRQRAMDYRQTWNELTSIYDVKKIPFTKKALRSARDCKDLRSAVKSLGFKCSMRAIAIASKQAEALPRDHRITDLAARITTELGIKQIKPRYVLLAALAKLMD